MPLDPNAQRQYLTKHLFEVECAGVVFGRFMKASVISDETEAIEIREGGRNYPRYMPGTSKTAELTLERGIAAEDTDLINWKAQVSNSRTDVALADDQYKRDLDLVQYNAARVVRRRVRLFNAWIKTLSLGDVDASASEVQVETAVLVYESWEVIVE